MKYKILFCMCFCSAVLMAQQPGQRFPNRPRLFPRMNQEKTKPGMQRPDAPPDLDVDGDGVISREEILAGVRAHLNSEREKSPQIFRRILQRFDADKDGEISDDEAMEMHRDFERRMKQGRNEGEPRHEGGRPQDTAMNNEEPRRLNDNGLLKGIKIEGLNISSDL
jgi:hypothetical protein